MDIVGLQRGVVIVMNPQTGEILAMVSLPTYDNNMFAQGISAPRTTRRLLRRPERGRWSTSPSASSTRPARRTSWSPASGALADGHITDSTVAPRRGPTSRSAHTGTTTGTARGFGPLNIYGGFAHSSDTFFYQLAGMLGIDRLAYWAEQFGFGAQTGIDLPGEASGIVPTNEWKRSVFNQPIYPGEVYQAGIGQGYDTATPLQVLNAYAALANGGRLYRAADRAARPRRRTATVVQDFQPELIRELRRRPRGAADDARGRARGRDVAATPSTSSTCPSWWRGKTGTAEFGIRDNGPPALSTRGSRPSCPKFSDGNAVTSARTDSELAVVAFSYDSKAQGNAATEIVKYFLQLHYDLDVDLRHRWLIATDNSYGN